ncbi:sporulation integral membrane protein YlbJ [Desulfofarcimen acetoxidans DSM 771]|uniref:Sporulation integral membrane protein YlbJ n=1 Tax=Desulfofarcimen acetoxidans (strain ATCC 49208 / DSM 771 / KCTC 5769 / VKM B-1644 / 5575) TaxID=485916 RepID=C8W575_DESAS|nr:sporulation integral membrane protein YlbJ [Desulfofarcimen acetoxidans]ACV62057.1 sporulation integral membrane protein YlbJ [Desulfofarcimen acetoxidans DSM 771]
MLIFITIFAIAVMSVLTIKYAFPSRKYTNHSGKIFWTACSIFFIIAMILQPQIVYEGSVKGLKTWFEIVLPSLLPFFIASELLMAFGVVHFMGILLEPVMRPVFNLPGSGSFVLAIGFTSGFPIGAMVTAKLRQEKLCTRIEAERLICFTNNSSPLFMLVAVAVGMFNKPELGLVIAGAHYLASLTLGICLRFYSRNDREAIAPAFSAGNILKRAIRQMLTVQSRENRPVGRIMSDVVKNSVSNLLAIGGFIILFAVLIRIFTNTGLIHLMGDFFGILLIPLGISPELLQSLGTGFWEMTLGTKSVCETTAPLLQKLVAVAIILGWGGLSVHAQVASMIAETDIRILPFVLGRIAHACIAGLYTYILAGYSYGETLALAKPVIAAYGQRTVSLTANLLFSFSLLTLLILLPIALAILLQLLKSMKSFVYK